MAPPHVYAGYIINMDAMRRFLAAVEYPTRYCANNNYVVEAYSCYLSWNTSVHDGLERHTKIYVAHNKDDDAFPHLYLVTQRIDATKVIGLLEETDEDEAILTGFLERSKTKLAEIQGTFDETAFFKKEDMSFMSVMNVDLYNAPSLQHPLL
ncbi:hypothetical protein BDW22DRAFT_1358264 [Trametopsis cervina]|nr:hypothetical protein BDW22DRAFT_1358264 [Trametopsis cervina]